MTNEAQENPNFVRPTDTTPRPILAKLLSTFRTFVGGDRFENLYRALVTEIHAMSDLPTQTRLLDYGCGVMSFSQRLQQEGIITSFVGMDIFSPPENATNPDLWCHYRKIPETGLGSVTEQFDITLVNDVLHHASTADQPVILRQLSAISRYILVKEHFEYGFISRQLLRLADWYGNYAYGVTVPKRYFDQSTWQTLLESAGLKELKQTLGVRVHNGVFGWIIPPHYHFISVLTRVN